MAKSATTVAFHAELKKPGGKDRGAEWSFLQLPQEASAKLPSRGLVTVEGTLNGSQFVVTLHPDGSGGHWMKVMPELQLAAGAAVGELLSSEVVPVTVEPEPEVPEDFLSALNGAPAKAREVWESVTPVARRDWIHWVTSGKKAETRVKRIAVACDMLEKGKKRPCCFDSSGIYSQSLSCPVADED